MFICFKVNTKKPSTRLVSIFKGLGAKSYKSKSEYDEHIMVAVPNNECKTHFLKIANKEGIFEIE